MSDYELAKAFFERLKSRGFVVIEEDFGGNSPPSEDDVARTFEIKNAEGDTCFTFDFLGGDFYRCSGFTSGFWQDEIDWKKYYPASARTDDIEGGG